MGFSLLLSTSIVQFIGILVNGFVSHCCSLISHCTAFGSFDYHSLSLLLAFDRSLGLLLNSHSLTHAHSLQAFSNHVPCSQLNRSHSISTGSLIRGSADFLTTATFGRLPEDELGFGGADSNFTFRNSDRTPRRPIQSWLDFRCWLANSREHRQHSALAAMLPNHKSNS